MKNLDPLSYKKNLAIVQQEPVLFSGTIRENILYGLNPDDDGDVSDDQFDKVCSWACVSEFVDKLEKGYDT